MAAPASAKRVLHWSERFADEVEARLDALPVSPDRVACASGVSPSGPIHMGNLREVFTTHLVADALVRRGRPVEHLHSWDDYDRLRKVPAGVEESFARYVGMPLAEVPDPWGEEASYADRFITEFDRAAAELGIEMSPRRQSQLYPAGCYNAAIRRAMDARELIFDTLAEQQTAGRHHEPHEHRRRAYFPFKPYCETCRKDETRVTAYADETVTYTCRCGHGGTMSLADGARISGKLVWKVDWPMRWAYEDVVFEPAGEDHHAPTGSFTVGRTLVREVFGSEAPLSTAYSFVTLSGARGKMSGSAGGATTPAAALRVLEPVVIRWPYVQRLPSQSFSFELTPRAIQRSYDHWDQYAERAAEPDAPPEQRAVHAMTVASSTGEVHRTPRPVSFRLLAAAADLTQANREQMARIVAQHLDEPVDAARLLEELEPRLGCAIAFQAEIVPPDQRTVVRDAFAADVWEALDDDMRGGVERLAAGLAERWSLDGLTKLVYAVPKRMRGLPDDAPPSAELKVAQREFFKAVYRLLTGSETGPRLPTLLLSIGLDRAVRLLGGERGR